MDNDKTVLVNYDNDMSLESAYMELGKAYYEGGFEDPLPQLLPLFDKITRLRNQKDTAGLETESGFAQSAKSDIGNINQQENAGFCPNCGTRLEAGALFCGNCGCKIE